MFNGFTECICRVGSGINVFLRMERVSYFDIFMGNKLSNIIFEIFSFRITDFRLVVR